MNQQKYIVYKGSSGFLGSGEKFVLSKDYILRIWKPKIFNVSPRGLFFKELLVWWLFHYFRIFRSQKYRIFVVYHKESKELAHYSVVAPKYFKTPFARKDDLQIGPVGTFGEHRRKGLASYAIQEILSYYKEEDPDFWYIVRRENQESRQLIEKIGFKKYGEGAKKGIFKKFVIENKY